MDNGKGKQEEVIDLTREEEEIDWVNYDPDQMMAEHLADMADMDEDEEDYDIGDEPIDVKHKLRNIGNLLLACHGDLQDVLCYLEETDSTVHLDLYKLLKLINSSQSACIDLKKHYN